MNNEPVAWMLADKEKEHIRSIMAVQHDFVPEGCIEIPLYTHPAKTELPTLEDEYWLMVEMLREKVKELQKDLALKTRDRDVFKNFTLAYEQRIAELEKDLAKYDELAIDDLKGRGIVWCACGDSITPDSGAVCGVCASFRPAKNLTMTFEEMYPIAEKHLGHAIGLYNWKIFGDAILKKASEG